MAKESILVGAVNDSGVKVGGTQPTTKSKMNGLSDSRLTPRTKSPRAQDEVTFTENSRFQK